MIICNRPKGYYCHFDIFNCINNYINIEAKCFADLKIQEKKIYSALLVHLCIVYNKYFVFTICQKQITIDHGKPLLL